MKTTHKILAGGGFILILTLILFSDILFFSSQKVLSQPGTDISGQFIYWRFFGFNQLSQGILPLWNPHIFSGTPFVGGFQSALFYPPNLLFLIFPLAKAINLSIALHVLLFGFFMFLWVFNRGISAVAALLAGVLAIFSGAFFSHIYAGHLSNLCVMPWVPLLFFAIDRFSARPAMTPVIIGILSVAMQILAGHPQYVFYGGVAATCYLLSTLFHTPHRLKTIMGFAGMYSGGSLISAVQLFTGLAATAESARSGSVPYDFAVMFAFPFENLLTLITPGFFGTMEKIPYWGRNYLWEMSLFIGLTGFILAIFGMFFTEKKIGWPALILFFIFLLFAFGKYTPLFNLLYSYIPGFNKFRGISKFIFFASLFLILLAAYGFDALLQKNRERFSFTLIPLTAGAILLCLGGYFLIRDNNSYQSTMRSIINSGDSYFSVKKIEDLNFVEQARLNSAHQFLWAGCISLFISLIIFSGKQRRCFLFFLPAIALIEMIFFALPLRPTFNIQSVEKPELLCSILTMPGDYRVLYQGGANMAMASDMADVWGYDPMVLKRYTEFMTYTQRKNPNQIDQYLDIQRYHPLYKMLRFRFIIPAQVQTNKEWIEFPAIMPRLNLIYNFTVLKGRDTIFNALSNPAFDPKQSVILESNPNIIPNTPEIKNQAEIIDSSVNHLTINAELASPAILLVTDLYAKGWQAKALAGSAQNKYQVLPANYILKAIPLQAGIHRLRLFYRPPAFIIGAWVSGLSFFCLIAGCILYYILRK